MTLGSEDLRRVTKKSELYAQVFVKLYNQDIIVHNVNQCLHRAEGKGCLSFQCINIIVYSVFVPFDEDMFKFKLVLTLSDWSLINLQLSKEGTESLD